MNNVIKKEKSILQLLDRKAPVRTQSVRRPADPLWPRRPPATDHPPRFARRHLHWTHGRRPLETDSKRTHRRHNLQSVQEYVHKTLFLFLWKEQSPRGSRCFRTLIDLRAGRLKPPCPPFTASICGVPRNARRQNSARNTIARIPPFARPPSYIQSASQLRGVFHGTGANTK